MSEIKFTKGIDSDHEIKLDPSLISAQWEVGRAYIGYPAELEVRTVFVGNNAPIEVKVKSESGKKIDKIKGKIRNNTFKAEVEIPDSIDPGDAVYFEVKLSGNNLEGESNRVPVLLAPELKDISWGAEEARRGDILTLAAELKNVQSGSEVKVNIYEYDDDGGHDLIVSLPAVVEDKKISLDWEYEYHEDTDAIPTEEELKKYGGKYNPPEYFFTVKIDNIELGLEQESKLLNFKDWIEFELLDDRGNPIKDTDYVALLPDGSEKKGKTDENGLIKLTDVPPGKVDIQFPSDEKEDTSEAEEIEEKDEEVPDAQTSDEAKTDGEPDDAQEEDDQDEDIKDDDFRVAQRETQSGTGESKE